MSNIGNSFIT